MSINPENQRHLVFATNNPNKIIEARLIMPDWHIVSLADQQISEDLPETGNTLKANALEKALHIYNHYNLDCFAEDTGLEVDFLQGAPGVYTARYAGVNATAEENIQKLLAALGDTDQRTARFSTVIALILKGNTYFFEGEVKGTISRQPSGEGGFGYDPVFIPEGYDQTFADLPKEIKKQISHRARALQGLTEFLNPD